MYYILYASDSFCTKNLLACRGEMVHAEHVRRTMRALGYKSNRHDWSKDLYYLFITNGKWLFNIDGTVFEKEYNRTVRAHHAAEPHHPEWESVHHRECDDDAIVEMAVDRTSRNLFKNSGDYNEIQMRDYTPTFTFNNAKKGVRYWRAVEKILPVARHEYHMLNESCLKPEERYANLLTL